MSSRVDQIGEGRHTVLAEYVAVFLEFVAECGLDATSVLASAGLSPEDVVQLPRFVGSKTYYRLIRCLLDQRPDPHHAYRFARRCSELRHGAAGMVAQNSETLREGLDLGLRYARPQLGNSERLVVRDQKKETVVLIRPPDPRIEVDESVDCFNSIVMLLGHELRGRRILASARAQVPSERAPGAPLRLRDRPATAASGCADRTPAPGRSTGRPPGRGRSSSAPRR